MEASMAASPLLSEGKGERLADSLVQARKKLDATEGEMILDFSRVRRIDSEALRAILDLAGAAESKKIKLILRGVNVDVYKVLKLMKLASQFSYLD
jgi:anti-anti-sigma regulatory factor